MRKIWPSHFTFVILEVMPLPLILLYYCPYEYFIIFIIKWLILSIFNTLLLLLCGGAGPVPKRQKRLKNSFFWHYNLKFLKYQVNFTQFWESYERNAVGHFIYENLPYKVASALRSNFDHIRKGCGRPPFSGKTKKCKKV
jgi:hypothetical protein